MTDPGPAKAGTPSVQVLQRWIVPALAVQQVDTDLAKKIDHIEQYPVLDDLAVLDLPEVHVLEVDLLAPPTIVSPLFP